MTARRDQLFVYFQPKIFPAQSVRIISVKSAFGDSTIVSVLINGSQKLPLALFEIILNWHGAFELFMSVVARCSELVDAHNKHFYANVLDS